MATRMRRNAESLLVLSGAEQPRQWQQPIALLDVVRAAAAEIADFPRVELVGIDDHVAVAGRAVADVAHLVAELLENATLFSPPDSAVVVSGATTESGFVLAVSDQGIGMPAERIVASEPAAGQAAARRPRAVPALGPPRGRLAGRPARDHGGAAPGRAARPRGARDAPAVGARAEGRADPAGAAVSSAPPAAANAGVRARGQRKRRSHTARRPPGGLASRRRAAGRGVATRRLGRRHPDRWAGPAISAIRGRSPRHAAPPTPPFSPVDDDPFAQPHRRSRRRSSALRRAVRADQRADPAGGPGPRAEPESPARRPSRRTDADEADPLRPYRVHELLTRHAQGKRRGREEQDGEQCRPDRSTARRERTRDDATERRGAQPQLAGLELRRAGSRRERGDRRVVRRPAHRAVGRSRPQLGRPARGGLGRPAEHRQGWLVADRRRAGPRGHRRDGPRHALRDARERHVGARGHHRSSVRCRPRRLRDGRPRREVRQPRSTPGLVSELQTALPRSAIR